jgi:hypothetical protein
MHTSSIPRHIHFGSFKEEIRVNRGNRNLITQADAENSPKLRQAATKLDAALVKAGLDTSKTSAQLKLSTVWPQNYIQLSVANESVKLTASHTLKELGAVQDKQNANLFIFDNQKVNLQTYAEADYQNGLPFTFMAKKFRQLKAAFQQKVGSPKLPS